MERLEPLLKPTGASVERVEVKLVSFDLSPLQATNLGIILQSGALDLKDGNFICHIDHDGLIRKIDCNKRLYAG
jgi:hypothetical protein